MRVYFHSDSRATRGGFRATYRQSELTTTILTKPVSLMGHSLVDKVVWKGRREGLYSLTNIWSFCHMVKKKIDLVPLDFRFLLASKTK